MAQTLDSKYFFYFFFVRTTDPGKIFSESYTKHEYFLFRPIRWREGHMSYLDTKSGIQSEYIMIWNYIFNSPLFGGKS